MADRVPKQRTPVSSYSPTPGCIIFAIGIVGIVALVGWFVYAGFRQSKEIEGFTEPKAAAVAAPASTPEALEAVQKKLADFSSALKAKQQARLELSLAELNTLLAGDQTLASVKDMLRVESVSENLRLLVSLPVKTFAGNRFLNGTMEFRPEIRPDQGLFLETLGISVPGKAVSEGFVRIYREMHFLDDMLLKPYREHPEMGAVVKAVTDVKCANNQVVLTFSPKQP